MKLKIDDQIYINSPTHPIKRIGYPLVPHEIDLESIPDFPEITEFRKSKLYHSLSRKAQSKIDDGLSYDIVSKLNFGGNEKKVIRDTDQVIPQGTYYISDIKIRKLGTYSSGWTNWQGENVSGALIVTGTVKVLTIGHFMRDQYQILESDLRPS